MKKLILSIIAFATIAVTAKAQDEAIFSHYVINPMLINPAYAGFNDNTQIFGHLRNQWSGFQNAPKTYALTVDLPMTEKVGIGGLILSEKFGALDRFRGQFNYAYRYAGKGYKWSIGFSTEFHRSKLDPSVNDQTANSLVDKNDPLVMQRIKGVTFFDASFGGAAVIQDKFLLSASLPNLIRKEVGGDIQNQTKRPSTLGKQFILMAGYRIKKTQLTFEPSIQMHKVLDAPFEVDLNAKVLAFDDKLVAALTMRPGNSGQVGLLVGTKQPNFSAYYSYNSSLAQFNAYERNGHEVTLGITLQKADKKIDRGNKRYRN
jgi:type IX secretion system PorP/SprF family membrane protein